MERSRKRKQVDCEDDDCVSPKQNPGAEYLDSSSQDESVENVYNNYKVFNDPIHGHIELHPLCVKIIDTIQFQRLRSLKQLGGCYFVYPGATHNRFEHSLGVCHLAGELIRAIRRRQPELNITDIDVLCVEIAGLCHDLGHGPFSHLFDGRFIPLVLPGLEWKHEHASEEMFDHLVKKNDLDKEFKKFGLKEVDKKFIKEQVAGVKSTDDQEWPYLGRGKEKSFLYEIVANKRNGVDVDKWDYFARDCHMLGIRNNFDHERYMKFVRVLQVKGIYQICPQDKEVANLYDMFHTRSSLHRRAYQHPVNRIIESMITEALVKANDHIKIKSHGKSLKMSETINNMDAFEQMTDQIFYQILWSVEPELKESREILGQILKRQLYKFVGQAIPTTTIEKKDMEMIKEELLQSMKKGRGATLNLDDLVLDLVFLDYGMKAQDPVGNIRFYNKETPDLAMEVRRNEVFGILPEKFSEQVIRLYCKKRDKDIVTAAKECFKTWSREKGYTVMGANMAPDMTPAKSTIKVQREDSVTPDRPIRLPNDISAGKFKSHLHF